MRSRHGVNRIVASAGQKFAGALFQWMQIQLLFENIRNDLKRLPILTDDRQLLRILLSDRYQIPVENHSFIIEYL